MNYKQKLGYIGLGAVSMKKTLNNWLPFLEFVMGYPRL